MSFGLINRAFCPKYVFKCICCSYECEEYRLNYCKSFTGTKCFALWHSSKMRHPLNCSPLHQSMSCCNLLWRLAPVKKKKKQINKNRSHFYCHTRRQFAASRRSDRSLHVYRSGDELQQQGEATRRSDKSLCVYWRIFVKNIFVSATEFCCCNKSQKIKSDWICATCCGDKILLQQQIFTKFSSTHEAICRCNVSPRHVAATCRLVCTDLQW